MELHYGLKLRQEWRVLKEEAATLWLEAAHCWHRVLCGCL
jgi:hypothetical protein